MINRNYYSTCTVFVYKMYIQQDYNKGVFYVVFSDHRAHLDRMPSDEWKEVHVSHFR